MGRELRRKQAKKEGRSLKEKDFEDHSQIKKYIKITGLLLFIFLLIYMISGIFVTKEIKWFSHNKTNEVNEVKQKAILAAAIFKQPEKEYYVYFYDFKNEDSQVTKVVTQKLANKKIYYVDTSSALNTHYVSTIGNKNAKTIEELKVVSPTVIKISDAKIVKYYESQEIITDLKS